MGAKLEDTVAINREIIHGYYQGDLAPWFSRLCSKSVWLGIGERVLFGEGAIRDYFKDYLPLSPAGFSERSITPSLWAPAVRRWCRR